MVAYKQTFPNSCGAVALMAASIELNQLTIPQSTIHPLWNNAHIMHAQGDRIAETLIYAVTSGSAGAPNNQSGYSLPSRIAIVAKELHLHSIAFVPKNAMGNLLLFLYGSEEIDAQRAGMLLKREAAPALQQNQFLLKVLRVGAADAWLPATGLHYVLQRADLSIMDPAIGQNFPDLATAVAAHHSNGVFYEDTGIAILLA
jgi:hypothetical protein